MRRENDDLAAQQSSAVAFFNRVLRLCTDLNEKLHAEAERGAVLEEALRAVLDSTTDPAERGRILRATESAKRVSVEAVAARITERPSASPLDGLIRDEMARSAAAQPPPTESAAEAAPPPPTAAAAVGAAPPPVPNSAAVVAPEIASAATV